MSSEDNDKHDGAEDVDFGEGEDFDELPADEGLNDATEVDDQTAAATDDIAEAPEEVPSSEAAEEPAAEGTGGAVEEAVAGDVTMTEPKTESPEAANDSGVDTADKAADGEGDEAVASDSAAAGKAGGGVDPLEEPPHGSEVFVGGIPKNSTVTDEQLLEFAQAGGEVFSCAILPEPGSTTQNRGYGFIKFKSKEIAQEAMTKLNDTQMKDHPGIKIRVLPSQAKNRLYLGNLPKEKNKDELHDILSAATKGLESVELLMSKDWPGQNRGFCFLEFYNHACAQAAKTALSPPNFQLGNKPLTITFAEPRRADTSADSQEIKSIFVGNLPDTANEAKLRELFEPLGEITRAFIPAPRDGKKRREFGFVHFQDRSSVVQAIANHERGEKLLMDSTPLEVKMGRVYHETPPQRLQQNSYQQGGYGGRGMGSMGMSMGAARFGGGRGAVYQQQQPGHMGGAYGVHAGYGDYGQYSGAMAGMTPGYGAGIMDGSYGMGGGSAHDGYDSSYGSYGGMAGMGAGGGMGGVNAAGMAMVPMMLPNGQIGYVLSNAGAAGGMTAGSSAAGAASMGMGGPMRGRTGYGGAAGSAAGSYGGMSGGRAGSGYGGRGSGQQRYSPY